MIDNPYRKFDKGMDDAYMGVEPQMTRSNQYMTGYEYATELLNSERNAQASVATDDDSKENDDKQKTNQ